MKRFFLLLISAIACGMGVMAQDNLVATLQHGSDIQAFYGEDALSVAHEIAEDGDIITLSAGLFKGCEITKALAIRGDGMWRTSITGETSFTLPQKTLHTLSLEGLQLSPQNDITFTGTDGSEKVVISKCIIGIGYYNIYFVRCSVTLIQSASWATSLVSRTGSHLTCINSLICGLDCYGCELQNCNLSYTGYYIDHSTIKNCIVYYCTALDVSNTSSHCLVHSSSSGFSDSWYVDARDGISLQSNDFLNDNHQLYEEAAATYIGTDGTQIGIFGGMYPWDETPNYAWVKTLDVIGSHKNGKLNVKINVK